jgi:hypothetical protein
MILVKAADHSRRRTRVHLLRTLSWSTTDHPRFLPFGGRLVSWTGLRYEWHQSEFFNRLTAISTKHIRKSYAQGDFQSERRRWQNHHCM